MAEPTDEEKKKMNDRMDCTEKMWVLYKGIEMPYESMWRSIVFRMRWATTQSHEITSVAQGLPGVRNFSSPIGIKVNYTLSQKYSTPTEEEIGKGITDYVTLHKDLFVEKKVYIRIGHDENCACKKNSQKGKDGCL